MNDREAFRQLVEQYKDKVVNTCFGFVHQKEDAEDIAQDVFIEAWLSYPKFRGESSLSTWLYRIAVNKSLDALRKQKTKKYIGLFKNLLHISDESVDNLKHTEPNPLQQIEQYEREQALYKALDKIPVNQKIAITLSKFEDLSMKEIADVMETSESAVESLLSRAKVSLRKHLEDYYKNI